MDEMHRTEVDGFRATWRLNYLGQIAIINVHNTFENLPIVTFGPDSYPDLVLARDQWPKLMRLWDAVRHDMWTELVPRYRPSVTARNPQ